MPRPTEVKEQQTLWMELPVQEFAPLHWPPPQMAACKEQRQPARSNVGRNLPGCLGSLIQGRVLRHVCSVGHPSLQVHDVPPQPAVRKSLQIKSLDHLLLKLHTNGAFKRLS